MASIFTYQEVPHKVHSPWSTPGSSTPQIAVHAQDHIANGATRYGEACRIAKLEPEKHDGPIEYKLHLLLRWRRPFTRSSTAMPAWTNQQSRLEVASAAIPSGADVSLSRSTYQPSTQIRQARLQQLTTQLLWRLQQSSPFHSASNAKLVLPVLPEATPRLGIPDRPSKLLPGLEESQGALYEIGVADDGTLVGLADEEMDESLTNLRAMAASLGCVVDIHRRVIVGDCEWTENSVEEEKPVTRSSRLWVAEVLVRPDNKNVEIVPADVDEALQALDLDSDLCEHGQRRREVRRKHVRVALVGASAAGKSSLLGTLTTSALDNGRGRSRLSLLKHRHEIASGVTSSVAQELLGYQLEAHLPVVINYATGDVSSWPDIHNLAERLIFFSDSPGQPRYSKSTFRALISWNPAWTILCIPANDGLHGEAAGVASEVTPHGDGALEPSLSLAHLDMCLKLGKPFIVAITKLDIATKRGLKQVLGAILTSIKAAGKAPILMNAPSAPISRKDDTDFQAGIDGSVEDEQERIRMKLSPLTQTHAVTAVPIIFTSAVAGSGISSLHALLRALPDVLASTDTAENETIGDIVKFRTDEVFAIPPSKVYSGSADQVVADAGVVLCGLMDSGTISLGDELMLGPFSPEIEEHFQARAMRRASSHNSKSLPHLLPRSLSENFSKSLQIARHKATQEQDSKATFVKVRVVSLRNLRLPVTVMHAGDTGTAGIQPVEDGTADATPLFKARKGMILTNLTTAICGYSSFMASFPYSDFGSTGSPPLILGGHAIAYIHSIRAAVKVIAVALEEEQNERKNGSDGQRSPSHTEIFAFDDEDDHDSDCQAAPNSRGGNLRISFNFVTTVEYLELNDQVLVVPNTTPAGPITGPASASTIAGFSGFVGRVCEVHV